MNETCNEENEELSNIKSNENEVNQDKDTFPTETVKRLQLSKDPSIAWLLHGENSGSSDSGVEMSGDSASVSPLSNMKKTPSGVKNGSPLRVKPRSSIKSSVKENDNSEEEESLKPSDMGLESDMETSLLTAVLQDLTESSNSNKDSVKEDKKVSIQKQNKSVDFEAKMASVAATLDLSKQRKRPAPRPPSAPPPEPIADKSNLPTQSKKVIQPDPVFKMVPLGKPFVTLPTSDDFQKSSIAPAGLEEYVSDSDLSGQGSGDGKSKKGLTSFFKSFLRRGKDAPESFEVLNNPDVQLSSKTPGKDFSDSSNSSSSVDLKQETISPPKAKSAIPPTSPSLCRDKLVKRSNTNNGSFETNINEDHDSIPVLVSKLEEKSQSSSPSHSKPVIVNSSPKVLNPVVKPVSPTTGRYNTQKCDTNSKPNLAPKPSIPPLNRLNSNEASTTSNTSVDSTRDETILVRRRAKSPKRTAAPIPSSRTSVATSGIFILVFCF